HVAGTLGGFLAEERGNGLRRAAPRRLGPGLVGRGRLRGGARNVGLAEIHPAGVARRLGGAGGLVARSALFAAITRTATTALRLEVRERADARGLALVAVQRAGARGGPREPRGEAVRAVPGLAHHEVLFPGVLPRQVREQLALPVRVDQIDVLADERTRRVTR